MIKKKVLFITSTFPLSEIDIQVPWMTELLKKLSEKLDIDVFAPAFKGSKSFSYFNIPVFRFRYAPSFLETLTHGEGALSKLRRSTWLFLIAFLYVLFGSISIIYIFKRNKYDVVHVNWPFPQGIFGLICKFINPSTKLILTFYGAEFSLMNRVPFGKIILKAIMQKADRITAISNATRKNAQAIINVPIEVIPFTSPILKDRIVVEKKAIGKQRKNKILFVGRLIDRKGISYLLDAMPKILSFAPSHLDVVGEGPLCNVLDRKIKEMSLQMSVTLHGKVDEDKLREFYRNCDVFVLPAIIDRWGDTEGLGVVLLEAMNFRKPVIASNVGGIGDIVRDGETGLLVPQKDSFALSEAIISIFADKKLRDKLANSGYKFVASEFSWDSIVVRTLKIYSTAIS